MGQVTETTIKMIEEHAARGEHAPLTVWELRQLAHAWRKANSLQLADVARTMPADFLSLPSGATSLGTYRNVDDGATYTWGRCDDGYFRLDQFGWATWTTEEGFSRALLAAAPQAPNCTRCSGSGEDPEGYLTHGRGPDDHTVDGPCRSCKGTGAAPQPPAALDELRKIAEIAACWGCDHPDEPGDTEVVRRFKWASRQLRAVAQAPAAPAVDAPAPASEWRDILTAEKSDDLIWLYDANSKTIDGPRTFGTYDVEEYTHWAPAEAPDLDGVDEAFASELAAQAAAKGEHDHG